MQREGLSDLASQLEEPLVAALDAEANWRFDDRLDLALRTRPIRGRHRRSHSAA